MNEIIKKIAEASEVPMLDVNGKCKYGDTCFSKEKFAELLIKECASLFDPDLTVEHEEWIVRKSILEHFGVKEWLI